ncbi:uncharacterized protein BDZ99DRAFT_463793 [Mytilinidion resinicola]|uniref:Uncharacterized protein n=1 Tax=Mytilinidion resinicola TaxID=574789 RepID=A0A6A6YJA2_9PEZI|nr:uncharacterized protein BDZ99DRAFT_463793 [Mytilinidion resinicola]KAF2808932.1 hypothetical protein BDZ99DRAFT_463793 [Mytilinidion resinicola]
MTSSKPPMHNIQVQVNRGCQITSLARIAPNSVAIACDVPSDDSWTARQIKDRLIASIKI